MSKPKGRRGSTRSSPQHSITQDMIIGLFDCYNFVSPNEYSEKTFGLPAFLLRKAVGDINFSDLCEEVERRSQQGHEVSFVTLLKNKRDNLSEIDASVEKCLIINRLIKYIEENPIEFNAIYSDIRLDMQMKLIDNRLVQNIQFPEDFQQREKNFAKRRLAQDMRRLFYYGHEDANQLPNIIQLQNSTTEQLSYLIDCKMRYDPKFREIGFKELEKIFVSSFMIIAHPHCNRNPVTIYDKKGPGEFTAKISVMIVSLLHDFMQTHSDIIELFDIETSLWPLSEHYTLEEPRTLSWKTCQLQISPGTKPQTIQYAELTFINIHQSSTNGARVHFNDVLHTLKFAIKLHLNLKEYQKSKTYQIPVQSAPFVITSHNNHISHMLTKIILHDIRRLSQLTSVDVKIVSYFILRYFIHRTGTEPDEHLKTYLEQELTRAKNERRNFQTLEDIYMDFLVPFVDQVEFMARHPILSMFYADNLSVGICNSTQSAEVMIKPCQDLSPIVAVRFNSIKVNYRTISSNSLKSIIIPKCAIRVDIYNERKKKFQYRTFDSSMLPIEIGKFVTTAQSEGANPIRILSSLNERINLNNRKTYADFAKYYDDMLHKIFKKHGKYRPLTNLINNIDEDEYHPNNDISEMSTDNAYTVPRISSPVEGHNHNASIDPKVYPQSVPNQMPLNHQITDQDVIQYVLSQPHLVSEIMNRVGNLQLQMPYQNQSLNTNSFSLPSQDFQVLDMLDDNFLQAPLEFMTTDQTTTIPPIEDLEQFLNSLMPS